MHYNDIQNIHDYDIVEAHCCVIRERKRLLSNSRNIDVV